MESKARVISSNDDRSIVFGGLCGTLSGLGTVFRKLSKPGGICDVNAGLQKPYIV